MGKQGPCYHCGVTSTPLWRNGPPEKPVLCNACGSRWRTKGTLVNYTPLHARAEGDENEDHKVQKIKGMSVNMKIPKRKAYQDNFTVKRANLEFNYGFKKALDEDVSNRSSSGSAISNSESCAQFSTADGSELTGPSQSNAWDTTVPCKRRTCVGRPKTSSVEKLTKDLYTILQEQQSSCLSGSSEEDLLYENEMPMISVEIGHGSVLMRDPHSGAREEESEASSLLVESKSSISEAYSHSVKPVENRGEKAPNFSGQTIKQQKLKRTKSQTERLQVLGRHSLPLCSIDLKDIFNFDEFIEQFSKEEQEQLMKFLPRVDSIDLPDSLRNMFEGVQFKENFSLFQQLVADGVFETSSSSGSKLEDFKTLMKLALSNPNKSRLLESYYNLKEHKKGTEDSITTASNSLITTEKPCESLNQNFLETKVAMRSPKQVIKIVSNQETKEMLENSGASLKPMNFTSSFAADGGSAVFGYENNDISDQDLLVDVPSNGSFPQAELLYEI